MELIDKSAVKAEIERRILEDYNTGDVEMDEVAQGVLASFKYFLDTLEVKEVENFIWNNARTTVPEDSTKQIICIKEDGLAVSTIGKIVNGTVKWVYLDDLLNTNSFNVEVKEVDLEKEYEDFVVDDPIFGNFITNDTMGMELAKHFFELGLKAKGE